MNAVDQEFKGENWSGGDLSDHEYDGCIFMSCLFGSSMLLGAKFIDCEFVECDLSGAAIAGAMFQNCAFQNCKLLGLQFDDSNDFLFSVSFQGCKLDFSSFYKRSMKNTRFVSCQMHEADFTMADLSGSEFLDCDLAGAVFQNTILQKADFRTAFNYTFDLEKNVVSKAKFSLSGLPGLLAKYPIIID